MSEVDSPNPDDQVYSPVGSDVSGPDDEGPDNGSPLHSANISPNNHKDFTFRMPSPALTQESIRSPASSTGKRGSCLTLMAPKSARREEADKEVRKSYGPYRDSPPFQKTRFFSSMVLETEPRSLRRSICSDILSSDDEFGSETHFLIATSIVFQVPDSKPNLVSVGPSPSTSSSPSTTPPPTEQPKRRPAPLSLDSERQSSGIPSRATGSVKNRLARLMTSKQEKRRGSYFMQIPNPSNSSILETPSFAVPNWHKDEPRRSSDSEYSQAPESRLADRDSWFGGRLISSPSRYSTHSQMSRDSYGIAKDDKHSQGLSRSSGFRRRLASHGQILRPDTTPAPSPAPTNTSTSSNSAPPAQKKRFVYSLTPSVDRTPTPHSNGSASTTLPSYTFPFSNDHLAPRNPGKAYSIRSVASNSSKLNLSPFDSTSFKSLTQRYNRTPTPQDPPPPSSSSSQRRPSGSLLSMDRKPDTQFRQKRANSEFSPGLPPSPRPPISPEGRKLSSTPESGNTTINANLQWGPPPGRKHKHSASKSMKWFQDKSGNVSQAGGKALLNGLGSMIRTKMS